MRKLSSSMSQNPSASRTATVTRRALAIMGLLPAQKSSVPSRCQNRDGARERAGSRLSGGPLGRFRSGWMASLERLVFAEIGDCQTQRIDGNEFVWDRGFENENKIRSIEVAPDLAVIRGRVINHVEIHTRFVGRGLHFFECDLLHVNVDLRS